MRRECGGRVRIYLESSLLRREEAEWAEMVAMERKAKVPAR